LEYVITYFKFIRDRFDGRTADPRGSCAEGLGFPWRFDAEMGTANS